MGFEKLARVEGVATPVRAGWLICEKSQSRR
jgi:hypothetical protein